MEKKEVSKILLEINAVVLKPNDPFTYTSGIKSPIYCDNRLILSYPEKRKMIIDAYLDLIEKNGFEFDVIAGVATGAIASAALIAQKLDKPMVYIRAKAKEHGKQNQVEGRLEPGQKVLVIEDLVSTGKSSVAAVEAVKAMGNEVVACVAVFTYDLEKAKQKCEEADCKLFTLTNFDTMLNTASETDYIDEEAKQKALEWNQDPEGWGQTHGF